MATEFPYSVQNDFPNQAVDLSVLTAEIKAGGGAAFLSHINKDGDTVTVVTTVDLSGGQEAALDALIAAHDGQPFIMEVQENNAFEASEATESGTSFVVKHSLQSGKLAAGKYLVTWYGELAGSVASLGAVASVTLDGVERASGTGDLVTPFFTPFSGSAFVDFDDLDEPLIEVAIHRVGVAGNALLRRVRLGISRRQDAS